MTTSRDPVDPEVVPSEEPDVVPDPEREAPEPEPVETEPVQPGEDPGPYPAEL